MLDQLYNDFCKIFEPTFQTYLRDLKQKSDKISIDADALDTFLKPLFSYVQDGKRVRPYLIAVGADSLEGQVVDAGVAFEVFHTFILMHDDIMDGAQMRRNVPTAHVAFEDSTPHGKWAAMLLGDFLMAAANEHMHEKAPDLASEFFKMQRFLCVGQYFELLNWGTDADRKTSEKIEYFKSAQYTFMYPLRLGRMLSGGKKDIFDTYSKYAGLAFQMRDDWLDVVGGVSGKDTGLDEQNGVPNTVQHILHEKKGNVEATKAEVQLILDEYQDKALDALNLDDVSPRQKESLTTLLEFVTRIS